MLSTMLKFALGLVITQRSVAALLLEGYSTGRVCFEQNGAQDGAQVINYLLGPVRDTVNFNCLLTHPNPKVTEQITMACPPNHRLHHTHGTPDYFCEPLTFSTHVDLTWTAANAPSNAGCAVGAAVVIPGDVTYLDGWVTDQLNQYMIPVGALHVQTIAPPHSHDLAFENHTSALGIRGVSGQWGASFQACTEAPWNGAVRVHIGWGHGTRGGPSKYISG